MSYKSFKKGKSVAVKRSRVVKVKKVHSHPYCVRHVSASTCYDIEGAASTTKTCPATIRNWIRNGSLQTIDNKKPVLIHGSDLQICISNQLHKRKTEIEDGEFYCFRCKEGRTSTIDSLTITRDRFNKPVIKGECSECGGKLSMISSDASLEGKLHVLKNPQSRLHQLSHYNNQSPDMFNVLVGESIAYNPFNERLIYNYLSYCKEAKGYSDKSIKTLRASLLDYQNHISFNNIDVFDKDKARSYKRYCKNANLSIYTVASRLSTLQIFLRWLKEQTGFKKKIKFSDIDYLNLPLREKKSIGYSRPVNYPHYEQAFKAVMSMTIDTPKQRRDRAMIALLILTGVRDGVVPFLRLKHLNFYRKHLILDPNEVPIKCGNYHQATFLPIPDCELLEKILSDYSYDLICNYNFSPEDPLFPKLSLAFGGGYYKEGDFSRDFMKDAQILTRVCNAAFHEQTGRKYSPHTIRHMLMAYGKKICSSPQESKAWSQNLGHLTTMHMMETYGQLDHERQSEIIMKLRDRVNSNKVT